MPRKSTSQAFSVFETEDTAQTEEKETEYLLVNEESPEYLKKVDLIDAIRQAPNKAARREAIADAAKALGKSTRTIKRMIEKVEQVGVATLAVGRKDKGQYRISKQWHDFIVNLHKWGNREGSRINHNQIFGYLKALASQEEKLRQQKYNEKFKEYSQVREDLIIGNYPSHVTVYKVINSYLEEKHSTVRHPGSPIEGQIIQTTEGILEITHSNQIWQIDHTKLDILLIDGEDKQVIGRPYITLVMDSYSGCVTGFHLGFEAAGSHEVGLALRHAILPKHYETEYELQEIWEICGIPEYVVTDRAKEFKSEHLKQISLQLNFIRRLRAFPQAGGLIESIFDKINKEILSLYGGYTGSSIEERPPEAERTACLTLDELEKRLVRYFVDHYNRHDYPRVKNQKRIERWKSSFLLEEPELIDERELDICLMKIAIRNVEKYGSVNFLGWVYQGDCLLNYGGKQISLRYDKRNITTVLAYTRPINGEPGEFLGIIQARDCERERMSLAELNYIKKKLRDEGKEIDNSSILNERLSRFEDVEQTRKERRRQRQKKAQQKHEVKTNKSKVVELFPENEIPEEVTTSEENLINTSFDADSPNIVNSIDKQFTQNKPDANEISKARRRPRVDVKDWNQFMRDNW
ncbi:Mu transposase C-terminal domain-containing protein [Nostoc sp. UHCC 0870]|uniref:Mu transposase C-terminal domain-containing protein n=1 Tax=Nostoc sp. UHCC 0870 TaxID=2914041 RepID=UPI001EDE79A7|nr:Mu transposase C-terminal domain-containing protein [Nostoc sp. UHCC 0870]UKO98335.1 DDE-type integrase/transposase/recombinase [Nostoc sp. UHCC 0870]